MLDLEQIKVVADMVGGLGDKAMYGFMTYIAADFTIKALEIAGWTITAYLVACKVIPKFISLMNPDNELKMFRDALGIGSSGDLWGSERRDTVNKVLELINKSKISE